MTMPQALKSQETTLPQKTLEKVDHFAEEHSITSNQALITLAAKALEETNQEAKKDEL